MKDVKIFDIFVCEGCSLAMHTFGGSPWGKDLAFWYFSHFFTMIVATAAEVRVGIPRSPTVLHREASRRGKLLFAQLRHTEVVYLICIVTISFGIEIIPNSLTSGARERGAASSSPNNAWRGRKLKLIIAYHRMFNWSIHRTSETFDKTSNSTADAQIR